MAGDARETFVNPAAALSAAQSLTAAGEGLWTKWLDLLNKISTANGAAPWGNDDPGKEFNKDYLGGDAPAKLTLDAAMELMPVYKGLGADVTAAVKGTVDNDDLIEKWFRTE